MDRPRNTALINHFYSDDQKKKKEMKTMTAHSYQKKTAQAIETHELNRKSI